MTTNRTTPAPGEAHPVVVASHPRSGTHLTLDLLRRQFEVCDSWKWPGERLDRLYVNWDARVTGQLDDATVRRIYGRTLRPLVKTHAMGDLQVHHYEAPSMDPAKVAELDGTATYLYVHRDGRDVLCSYHLFAKRWDERALAPIADFLRQEVDGVSRVRFWARHVESWLDRDDVTPVRYETLVRSTRVVVDELAGVLDARPRWVEPLLPPRLESTTIRRLNRLLRFRPPTTSMLGRPQGYTLEKWREAFTPEDRAFFHAEAGEVLVRLGYEPDDSWVR